MASPNVPVPEEKVDPKKLSGIGATENEVNMKDTVPQRVDNKGTKIEDVAGTGEIDSEGG